MYRTKWNLYLWSKDYWFKKNGKSLLANNANGMSKTSYAYNV